MLIARSPAKEHFQRVTAVADPVGLVVGRFAALTARIYQRQ